MSESELLPYFLEIAKFDRIESSRTLRHCHTVPRYRVSHVVVVYQVRQRSVNHLSSSPYSAGHLSVYCWLDAVVFKEVRGNIVYSCSQLFNRVVGKADTTLFRKGSQDFPLITRMAWRVDDSQSHLHSSLSINCIKICVP